MPAAGYRLSEEWPNGKSAAVYYRALWHCRMSEVRGYLQRGECGEPPVTGTAVCMKWRKWRLYSMSFARLISSLTWVPTWAATPFWRLARSGPEFLPLSLSRPPSAFGRDHGNQWQWGPIRR